MECPINTVTYKDIIEFLKVATDNDEDLDEMFDGDTEVLDKVRAAFDSTSVVPKEIICELYSYCYSGLSCGGTEDLLEIDSDKLKWTRLSTSHSK